MTCVGQAGHHNVQPSNKTELHAWRDIVTLAGRRMRTGGLAGPVGVMVTFTVPRPATVLLRVRAWPTRKGKGTGDVDKLLRAVLDGLTAARVYGDDAQVCETFARKVYPDTPDVPDRLPDPGAVIRIYTL
jgi:Holliday junction resolvase RusA-like endonuclease